MVPSELELGHGVNVLNVKLDRRPVWCLRHPHVQVHSLPDLEEDRACAALQLRDLVHHLLLPLRVQLVLLLAVGQELQKVLKQVPVPVVCVCFQCSGYMQPESSGEEKNAQVSRLPEGRKQLISFFLKILFFFPQLFFSFSLFLGIRRVLWLSCRQGTSKSTFLRERLVQFVSERRLYKITVDFWVN